MNWAVGQSLAASYPGTAASLGAGAFSVTDPACRSGHCLILGRREGNTITHAGPFGPLFTAIVDQTVIAE